MAEPATKLERFSSDLQFDHPLSEFELQRIVAECKAILRQSISPRIGAHAHSVLAQAYFRLGKARECADEAKIAARIEPRESDHLVLIAAACLELGDNEAALKAAVSALELTDEPDCILLGNLAEAFYRMGDTDTAEEAFERAARAGNPSSASDMLCLANQAVELKLYGQCFGFLARYLSIARGTEVSPREASGLQFTSEEQQVVRTPPGLRRLLERALLVDAASASEAQLRRSRAGDGALSVFDETRR